MRAILQAGYSPAVPRPFRALRFRVTRYFLALCLALLPCAAQAASFASARPAARIIYTADTLGYLHPCSTCGGAQGGLARRAHLLPLLVAESPRTLVLAGPGEFYADRTTPDPENADKLAKVLHAAFTKMPYAGVYLSPTVENERRRLSLPALVNGVPVTDTPVINYYRAGRFPVACVFLPMGKGDKGAPTPEQVLAAQNAAREAGNKARLVVAISPWGMVAENTLLPEFTGYFHIVLGGGPGIALPGQTMRAGTAGPVWIRSDRRGRAVNVLDILSLPDTRTSPWIEGIHFSSRLVFLEKDLPENEEVKEIISAVPRDKE
ncbi:hypothetical protein LJC26_03670 [Desulfovibrio sp. OttesenSCG-928-O18]|nr:hypothetical protein [Desulfovibrio sp. OttesenSCG-928-O18]